ncbi:MAG TPA: four helix bundle protein [Terracidiphilus sp.]|nr:four helix bundle protein [Terracidiphilus sp.]
MGASFKDLVVWQRAVELCLAVYKMTSKFPDSERFGLTNQLRRAAVSIASNIAEGYGRSTKGEYILFLGHARGSLCELQTQLIISGALQMGMEEMRRSAETLSADVSRMLIAIMAKLRDQKAHSAL